MIEEQRGSIRLIDMGTELCIFEIPDWKPHVFIEMSKWSIPAHLRQYLHPGFRVWISFNPNAKRAEHLNIKWG